ncbi:hypothetical protein SO802_026724, partial [Lithocarpus litseifolius]
KRQRSSELQEIQAQSHKKRAKSHCSFGFLLARENQGTFFVVGTGEMHGGVDVWWAQSILFLNQK